jgi:hypothetical protein
MTGHKNNTNTRCTPLKIANNRLDALDLVQARHTQVQAILTSLALSFDAKNSIPGSLTVQNTIWAAQALLEQAQAAMTTPHECAA